MKEMQDAYIRHRQIRKCQKCVHLTTKNKAKWEECMPSQVVITPMKSRQFDNFKKRKKKS